MKIKDSQIIFASSRTFQETSHVQTDYHMAWNAVWNDRLEKILPQEGSSSEIAPSITLNGGRRRGSSGMEGMAKSLLEFIIQKMISMEFLIGELSDFRYQFQPVSLGRMGEGVGNPSFEMRYILSSEQRVTFSQKENTRFCSQGVVQTEEGKNIDFSIDLHMRREYVNETLNTAREEGAIQWIDPLVLTFEGQMPELSDCRFSFDLDTDGQKEEIALLKAGVGFLSFDQNRDGLINDGGELFGPSTGRGFDELKSYDLDHNQWIDENDAIYKELSIWTPDENGGGAIMSLKEKSVGAIYLGHAETLFTLKEPKHQLNACNIKESGIFLTEEGQSGVIQELDFNPLKKMA